MQVRVHLHIYPENTEVRVADRIVVFEGRKHDIIRHVALLTEGGGAVRWSRAAGAIWKVNATEQNWQTNRARLAVELRQQGLPADLVGGTNGHVSLLLREGIDTVTIYT